MSVIRYTIHTNKFPQIPEKYLKRQKKIEIFCHFSSNQMQLESSYLHCLAPKMRYMLRLIKHRYRCNGISFRTNRSDQSHHKLGTNIFYHSIPWPRLWNFSNIIYIKLHQLRISSSIGNRIE